MASTGRLARLACSGVLVIAAALPGTCLGADAQLAALNQAAEDSLRVAAAKALADSREVQRGEPARVTRAPASPASQPPAEPKPYAMLLAGLGLIVFIARRRTKARDAGG
jgi:MYXO-CTERM domain-containing protein